ncbi:MAG: hypothetical protein ABSF82_13730 [Candidatus Bathyarchaeia archaeon]
MNRRRRIFKLLLIASLIGTIALPQVHAQTTNITNVEYPRYAVFDLEQRTADPPLSVKATVMYSDAKPGYYLGVGIFDLTTGNLVAGSGSALPGVCALGYGYAGCIVRLTKTSGSEYASFSLSQPQPIMNLALVAGLFDNNTKQIQSSLTDFEFTIRLTSALTLQLNVPSNVRVTVDSEIQPAGSVRLKLVVGTHRVSVPDTVQIDNTTRLKFEAWSDGVNQPNRTVLLNHDVILAANYTAQYLLAVSGYPVNATGTGWYDQGTTASFSVPSVEEPMSGFLGILRGVWKFQGWYENGTLLTITKDGSVTMNTAHALVTHWHGDYAFPMTIIGLVSAAAILTIVRFRKRQTPRRRVAGDRKKRATHRKRRGGRERS